MLLGSSALGTEKTPETIRLPAPPSDYDEAKEYVKTMERDILPKLRLINTCMNSAYLFLTDYKAIKNAFFSPEPNGKPLMLAKGTSVDADVGIVVNFNHLSAKQIDFVKHVNQFVDEVKQTDINDARAALKSIDLSVESLTEKSGDLVVAEDSFLEAVRLIEDFLDSMAPSRAPLLKIVADKECAKYNLHTLLGYLHHDSQLTLKTTADMVGYIREVQIKRQRYVNYAIEVSRAWLKQKISYSQIADMEELLNDIDKFWELDRLTDRWFVFRRTVFDHQDTRYRQYRQPLRRLQAKHHQVWSFKERVEALDAPGGEVLLGMIDSMDRTLSERIETLKTKGWQGQFDIQRQTVDALLSQQSLFKDSCVEFLEKFKAVEETITSLETFEMGPERLYLEIIDRCRL